jgi:hypothetical protein
MKSLIVAALTAMALLLAFSGKSRGQTETQAGGPWQVGRCYRVIMPEPSPLNTFQVLGPASGNWVRVQQVPASPPVPGGQPSAPLWINTTSPFAVQEWSCKG